MGRFVLVRVTLLVVMLSTVSGCGSQEEVAVQMVNTTKDGVAINGYDVVSYFEGRAEEGSADHHQVWNAATFRFVSERHRDEFAKNPKRYVPQYGGHCSFGMGFGKAVPADPEAFVVQNDKLYLNASPLVLRFWQWFGDAEKSERKWRTLTVDAT